MIPSDHFVYFYNEIFKELEKLGPEALDKYYARVADRQADFALKQFRERGLKGMYEYWDRIRIEENCKTWNEFNEEEEWLCGGQLVCPSLTKALESDAGPCAVYCNHCPGWALRVIAWAGYYACYNLIDRTKPRCIQFISRHKEHAVRKKAEWLKSYAADLIYDNFDEVNRVLSESGALK